jgi:hypothetical protein
MKLQPLSLVIVFAALTPSLALSQNPQVTNCHTPESAGNFVGSDETMVNGMVCKTLKTQPAQQQIVAQQSTGPANISSQESGITNARVTEMSKLGLDDDIIIARIKHGPCHFQLNDADLLDMKKAGVSPNVIAAMLDVAPVTPVSVEAAATTVAVEPATVPSDGKVRVFVTDSQSWETRGGSSGGGNQNGWGGHSWMAGGRVRKPQKSSRH